jgi:hypothetical protein
MHAHGIGLAALLIISTTGVATAQTDPYPDPAMYEARKGAFTSRLPEKFSQEERAAATLDCLARQGGHDPNERCSNWYGLDAWYELGWTVCRALRSGYSRNLILKELLLPDETRFNEAIFATATEVLCPEFADKASRSERQEPPPRPVAADPDAWKPDAATDRKFIDRMIEHLPGETREDYRHVCKNYDQNCPLWGFSEFGNSVCEELGQGRTREQVLEGMAGFFKPSEDLAIVETAVEVICPQYGGRK